MKSLAHCPALILNTGTHDVSQLAASEAMNILISPQRVEWVIHRYRWLIFAGLALCIVGARFETFGVVTGAFILMLGGSGGSFGMWRRELGLWMLASLFLVLCFPLAAIFEYHAFVGDLRNSRLGFWRMVDFVVGPTVLMFQVRFLATVARFNWLLSRQMRTSG